MKIKTINLRSSRLAQAILLLLSTPSVWAAAETVALKGISTPDIGKIYWNPVINDSGQLAFQARVAQIGVTNGAIYSGVPSELKSIVFSGIAIPEGNGLFGSLYRPRINELGQIAFRAGLTSTSGGTTDDSGIYLYNGTSLNLVARENQSLPEGNGQFSFLGKTPCI